MPRIRIAAVITLAAVSLGVGACGDDANEADGGASRPAGRSAQMLSLTADSAGRLAFDKETLKANAGKVTITLENPSDLPHAIEVEGPGLEAKGETVDTGGTSTVTTELKTGTYEYYCPVDGHKAGGMTGTLTVQMNATGRTRSQSSRGGSY